MHVNEVSGQVVDSAFKVHTVLGPGLFERVYQLALAHELKCRGLAVCTQVSMPIDYQDLHVADAYRLDLLVEGCVAVELKSLQSIAPIHKKQLLTYLRLGSLPLGLLLNFGASSMHQGVTRVSNDAPSL